MSITSFFVPNRQNISTISQANPCSITTTQNHGYQNGIFVRVVFPGSNLNWGMQPLSNNNYPINVTGSTTFTIPVDSTKFTAFNPQPTQFAQVVPTGEQALTLLYAVKNNDNIVPET